MNYNLTKPCANCPFRTDIKPYLNASRVPDLEGVAFSCHKTTTCRDVGNSDPKAEHCAGSLILHEKLEQPHQMMRIAERLGYYDHTKLDMDAPVFDSFEEMADAMED